MASQRVFDDLDSLLRTTKDGELKNALMVIAQSIGALRTENRDLKDKVDRLTQASRQAMDQPPPYSATGGKKRSKKSSKKSSKKGSRKGSRKH